MDNTDEFLTIREASLLIRKSEGLLYRYIREGKLKVQSCSVKVQGKFKEVKRLKKQDIIDFFGLSSEQVLNNYSNSSEQLQNNYNKSSEHVQPLTRETIKEVIEDYFQDRETRLMKPLEEQSLFLAGKLQAENQFLKDRLETVLQELEEVRASIKALPGPPVEIAARLEEQDRQIGELEKSRIELQERQEEKEQETELFRRKAGDLETRLETEEKEKQDLKNELEKGRKEEGDLRATIEELKRRLETEEKKPWYRKLF